MLPRGVQGFGPGGGSLDLPSSGSSDGEFGGDCGGMALVTEEGKDGLLVKTLWRCGFGPRQQGKP